MPKDDGPAGPPSRSVREHVLRMSVEEAEELLSVLDSAEKLCFDPGRRATRSRIRVRLEDKVLEPAQEPAPGPRPGKWIVLFPMEQGQSSALVREVEASFPEEALERSGAWEGSDPADERAPGPGIEPRGDGGFEWDDHWVYPPELRHVAAAAVLAAHVWACEP